jgi:hypothetical protein
MNNKSLEALVCKAERIAIEENSTLAIFRTSEGWSVLINSPNSKVGDGLAEMEELESFASLELALTQFTNNHVLENNIKPIKRTMAFPVIKRLDTPLNDYLEQNRKDKERSNRGDSRRRR